MGTIAPMGTTTIEISTENWQWLNSQKQPGESFNDVLDRLRGAETSTSPYQSEGDVEQLPDDLDLPGSGDVLDRRRATVARLYALLQERGRAEKGDFLEAVDAEAVGYSSPESFWSNCIKGRDSLKALPGVQPPSEGGRYWRFEE